jgi:hypothetical protein
MHATTPRPNSQRPQVTRPSRQSKAQPGKPSCHDQFQAIWPRIEQHARIYFRKVGCPHKKADCIAETVALAWKWFVRLAERGKDATRFPSVLATYAARAVRSGRRVCGQQKAKDAMNDQTQQRHGFSVGKLPDFSTESTNPLAEALADNTQTPPPDAAAFRIDFPSWLAGYSKRDRAIIKEMAQGERTKKLAARYRLSQGRISQMRRECQEAWEAFHDGTCVPVDAGWLDRVGNEAGEAFPDHSQAKAA